MGINYIDVIIFLFVIYFIFQGYHTGFLGGMFNILSTIVAFSLAFVLYPSFGKFLENQFSLGENLSIVAAFF